jgi:hypothetical protein
MRLICFAGALLAVTSALPLLAGEEPAPRMVLTEDTWDFGALEEGQTATKTIEVRNAGTAELRITFIRSSCPSCTGSVTAPEPIPPGKSGAVKLTFYSKGLSGRQDRTVYVHGNDPETPFRVVRIVGTVRAGPRPELRVLPGTLDVGLVKRGEKCVRRLGMANTGKAPLAVTAVIPSEACSLLGAPPTEIEPGGRAEVVVALDTSKLKGLVQEHVTVQTNDPITPTKTVLVVGYAADAASFGGAGACIVLRPEGEPVKVPGTRLVFYPRWGVTNRLAVPVRIARNPADEPEAGDEARGRELKPGEASSYDVPAESAAAGGNVSFTIFLPTTLPEER